ncbi:MAG: PP2C family protein-serine/threonine phosphatase [Acidobacteriota bacterium]
MPPVASAPADAIGPQHRNVPRFLRLLVASLLAGSVVGFLMWLGDTRARLAPGVLIAAWVAGWIYLASDLLLTVLERPLNRLDGLSRTLAIAGLFFGAGALGWQLAALTLPWITGGGWRLAALDWRFALGFAGGVGAFFGLLIFGYERLRDRLAESVVRLKEKEFADQELRTARDIQQRLLPPPAVEGPGYRVAARNLAAQVVAGDFYDIFPLDGEALGLAVGDVAGKGMGASLLMASVKAMLPLVASGRDAASALAELNRRLVPQLGPRQFVALCLVRYRPASGEFELANAGMPEPYLVGAGGASRPLPTPGTRLPLGLRSEVVYQGMVGHLGSGERLLLCSDGLPEAPTTNAEPLGYAAFEGLLVGLASPAEAAIDDLFARLEARARLPREDDWTALLLERSG